jgi:anti-sigma regulatory factor (Ser/Thr protein kinase)
LTDSVIERAQRLRVRSQELREHSELLSQQTVERLRLVDAPPFGASGNNFALRIARIRPAVALLRDCLGRWLESRGVDRERGHEIVLACSEACANAIEHPLADSYAVEVEASHRAGEVVVVVRDFGRWRPERASDARGRGLQMMRSLMSEVDVRQGETGTEIVMRERLD